MHSVFLALVHWFMDELLFVNYLVALPFVRCDCRAGLGVIKDERFKRIPGTI